MDEATEHALLQQAARLFTFEPDSARRLAGNSGDPVYEVDADGQSRVARIAGTSRTQTLTARRLQMAYQRELAGCSRADIRFSSPLPSVHGNLAEAVYDGATEWHALIFQNLPGVVVSGFDLKYNFDLDGDVELSRWCQRTLGAAVGIMHQCAKRHPVWMEVARPIGPGDPSRLPAGPPYRSTLRSWRTKMRRSQRVGASSSPSSTI